MCPPPPRPPRPPIKGAGVAVETHVVSEAPFSKLDSIPLSTIDRPPMRFRRAPYNCNPMAQSDCVSEALRRDSEGEARKLNVKKIKMMLRSVLEVDISLLSWGWGLHPDSPQHRPASPIQDLIFIDWSTLKGVDSVSSQDDNLCSEFPFQVECRIPDACKQSLRNADFQKIPEQIFF
jgi:hypothetical protein